MSSSSIMEQINTCTAEMGRLEEEIRALEMKIEGQEGALRALGGKLVALDEEL